jgi:hypothetical protein
MYSHFNKRRNLFSGILLGYIISLSACSGCGNTAGEIPEGEEFLEGIQFEKDTFLYPLNQWAPGTRLDTPENGLNALLDGNKATYWLTTPGNIAGEYIEFEFDSLDAGSVQISIPDEMYFARINGYHIYVNGREAGFFPAGVRIPLSEKIGKLRIELGETEGMNKYDLPVQNDSSGNDISDIYRIEQLYSSKSAAISEIEFRDRQNKQLHVRGIPLVRGTIHTWHMAKPAAFNGTLLMSDGLTETGWTTDSIPEDTSTAKVLITFPEAVTLAGLRLYSGDGSYSRPKEFTFNLRKRAERIYHPEWKNNRADVRMQNAAKGKNFIFIPSRTEGSGSLRIAELRFFDGSRWFQLRDDSISQRYKVLTDSIRQTPLAVLMDRRILQHRGTEHYAVNLRKLAALKEEGKKTRDTLPVGYTDEKQWVHIRSGGYIEVCQEVTRQENGKVVSDNLLFFRGIWRIVTKGREETVLEAQGVFTEGGKLRSGLLELQIQKKSIQFSGGGFKPIQTAY